jgi:hypothetical protein
VLCDGSKQEPTTVSDMTTAPERPAARIGQERDNSWISWERPGSGSRRPRTLTTRHIECDSHAAIATTSKTAAAWRACSACASSANPPMAANTAIVP